MDRFLSRWRRHRQPASLLIDLTVVAFGWQLTYLFRLGFERWWSARPAYDLAVMLGVVVLYALVFQLLGVPRNLWRFSGFGEVKRLAVACGVAGALAALAVRLGGWEAVPRAVLGLHPLLSVMGLCAVRVAYRMLYEHIRFHISGPTENRQALVLGAGEAAKLLLAGLHQQGWSVVALLDDDPLKRGARINGVPVRGTLEAVASVSRDTGATHLIIALPGASAPQRRRAFDLAAATALPVLTVPSVSELREGRAPLERVRAIEPDDLLGREPVDLDSAGLKSLVSGKTVLVTGAGGSIGSELCRQLAGLQPARLVLYELSEFALYQIEQQLIERHPELPIVPLMGDVKDLAHLTQIFKTHRPALIFHAAAFKHVPLMEQHNAWAALQNNSRGTYQAALAAARCGAERFVLISTDKAVNPTNVMGASKRLAEILLSHLARTSEGSTQFSAVRFGNVLGSSGSVVPRFKEQIARGGPVTVTHPEITRYFMTHHEAVRLVLEAASLARSGQVHVLDMGKPVKIAELARDLIRLSGHREHEIPIVYTGLRPGEKLYEELLADADQTLGSEHPRLRIAKLQDTQDTAWIEALLEWLESRSEPEHWRAQLKQWLPEYTPL
ncbi:MAG: nucleoside-diphosphate sugar epimerase/dehydratase [Pseudomonadota bacterium]